MTITESVWLCLQWYKAEVFRSLDNDNYSVNIGMFLQGYPVIAGMWQNLDQHLSYMGYNKTPLQIHKLKIFPNSFILCFTVSYMQQTCLPHMVFSNAKKQFCHSSSAYFKK